MSNPNSGRGRPTRRRSFDDDAPYERPVEIPRTSAPPPGFGPEVGATVKWFNAEKGFGFAELADGTGDAFLHVNVLSVAGHTTVPPGASLRVRVGQGQKGPQISQVLSVDTSTAAAQAPRSPDSRPRGEYGAAPAARSPMRSPAGPRRNTDQGPGVETQGVVKWYNSGKGFGFVAVSDGGKDVFVHATALQRAGLFDLAEGQAVVVGVVQGAKGPEATFIREA